MHPRARIVSLLLSLALVAVAGVSCTRDAVAPARISSLDRTGAGGDDIADSSSTPHFLSASASAPAIANPVLSFWAKKGVETYATMYYHAQPGSNDSTAFLRFRLRAASLAAMPDGTPIAVGDSVLITISLIDPDHLIVDCQPSGLTFAPDRPAVLKMSYAETNGDVNGDGVVDQQDTAILRTLRIWRREALMDPWMALVSNVDLGIHEVETDITGFSGYAVAY